MTDLISKDWEQSVLNGEELTHNKLITEKNNLQVSNNKLVKTANSIPMKLHYKHSSVRNIPKIQFPSIISLSPKNTFSVVDSVIPWKDCCADYIK